MKVRKTLVTVLIIFLTFGYFSEESNIKDLLANTEKFYTKIKIFTSIIETVNRAYVEQTNPDNLIEDAIKGVISNLDPHTVYLPSNDFKIWNQSFEGYSGIGISFELLENEVTVMTVLNGSPAQKNNLLPGDKILKINGESLRGLKIEDVRQHLLGPVGTPVELVLNSGGKKHQKKVHLIRQRINLTSITHAFMLNSKVGFIKLERFTTKTPKEMEKALVQLESKGMKSLILDLRGNGGGYLNSAIEVLDKFIPGGQIVLTTRGRLSNSYQEFVSTNEGTHKLTPLVVLVDHGSASASEIVAGAIQDLDRGLIVGKTSFGKGLVQSQYRFYDGSALLITTAKYYTPSGRGIQREYFDMSKDEYYREAYDDDMLKDEQYFSTKPQFKTQSGRTVYGGGGITPDVWIDNDENILSHNLRQLFFSEKRTFYEFCENFVNANAKIKTSNARFLRSFMVTDRIYSNFIKFVRVKSPELYKPELYNDKEDIKFLIKRELAYMLWGKEAQFKVNMTRDKQLQKGMEELSLASKLLLAADF